MEENSSQTLLEKCPFPGHSVFLHTQSKNIYLRVFSGLAQLAAIGAFKSGMQFKNFSLQLHFMSLIIHFSIEICCYFPDFSSILPNH